MISVHCAVGLFCNKSQRMTKCGKNISDIFIRALCSKFLFLPHFDVICDLLLNRCTITGNSFVNFSNKCFICEVCSHIVAFCMIG